MIPCADLPRSALGPVPRPATTVVAVLARRLVVSMKARRVALPWCRRIVSPDSGRMVRCFGWNEE